jgi:hypothetical protein
MHRLLSLLLALVVVAGCTSRYQVRGTEVIEIEGISLQEFTKGDKSLNHQLNMESQSVEYFNRFTVGVLEIDDEGSLNQAQYRQVMKMIREKTVGQPATLVVFIHGWHHGPRTCDRDLCCFRRVLEQLKDEDDPRNLVGLFIGWRGESSTNEKLSMLTLLNRKRVAERIGRTTGKEILLDLNDMWLDNPQMTMVSVGHSLGGAFLFKAAKGKLTGNIADIADQRAGYRAVRSQCNRVGAGDAKALRARLGDLIVLVNPAIEASEWIPFDKDLKDPEAPGTLNALIDERMPLDKTLPYAANQLPVLITLASSADTAVGRLFPIARAVTGKFSGPAARGMGRYGPHITHDLSSVNEPLQPQELKDRNPRKRSAVGCDCTMLTNAPLATPVEGTDFDRSKSDDTQEIAGRYVLTLAPERKARGWDTNSPYYTIRTTAKIAAEHSDIFNPEFVGFLANFISSYAGQKRNQCKAANALVAGGERP